MAGFGAPFRSNIIIIRVHYCDPRHVRTCHERKPRLDVLRRAGGVDGYRHETTLFRTPFCKRRKAGLWPWEQGKGYGAVDGTYLPSGPRSGCGDYPGDSLSLLQVPFDVLEARHEA